jgi:hypothetical protein
MRSGTRRVSVTRALSRRLDVSAPGQLTEIEGEQ